jgi:hypothetical protein
MRVGEGVLYRMCSLVVAQAPSGLDEGFDQQGWQGLSVTVKLLVSFTGKEALEDVTITVSAPPPFTCDDETQVLSRVDGGGGTPRAVPLTFRLASAQLPAHTSVIIGALYTAKGGEPRSVFTSIKLPLRMYIFLLKKYFFIIRCVLTSIKLPLRIYIFLFFQVRQGSCACKYNIVVNAMSTEFVFCVRCGKAAAPVKYAAHKITIDCNRQPPSLPALFEDVCPQDGPAAVPTVLTFMYAN